MTAAASAYFGFVSEIGISSIEIGAKGPPTNIGFSASNWGYDAVSRAEIESIVQEISIDIKPGSDPNSINPASRGKIPVAVLTTDTFDAIQVDPLSVAFGPDGAAESHRRSHVEDIDDDGDADLVLHFKTQETGIQCGDTEATLTGETFGGQAITGSDAITTVNCP